METLEVTVSLARAHKVVDHIRERLAKEQQSFQQNSDRVSLTGHAGAQQVKELQLRRARAESALKAFRDWNRALTTVRSAIGRANVSAGVADLLTEREALHRELDALKHLLTEAADAIQVEELPDFRPLSDGTQYPSVSVALSTPAQQEEARQRSEALRGQLFRLGNQLADANHQRVALALPRAIAEQLGFTA